MSASRPLPPPELAGYILGFPQGDLEEYLSMGVFLHDQIIELAGEDFDWEGSRVLDFGCGSARVLRHFIDQPAGTELHGVELDERCVAWVQANLSPPLQVARSSPRPPLAFPSEHFDLVWAMSVFSHLSDSWAEWLLELHRVTRPGGRLIISVMGAASSEPIAGEPWQEDRIGMNVLGYGRPWSGGGPMVLHSQWWIRAHWQRAFTIEAFVPEGAAGQDAVVLRRDERPAPSVQELIEPEPGEPRELIAARHTIAQLNREHATLNAQHDAYAAAYIEEIVRHQATERRVVDLEARLLASEQRGVVDSARATARALRRHAR